MQNGHDFGYFSSIFKLQMIFCDRASLALLLGNYVFPDVLSSLLLPISCKCISGRCCVIIPILDSIPAGQTLLLVQIGMERVGTGKY